MPTERETRTIRGTLTYVYATGGTLRVRDENGKEWDLRLLDPRYWASGAEYRAYQAALRVKKLVGRDVTAHIEYHPAFGWTIFGGKNIRLTKTPRTAARDSHRAVRAQRGSRRDPERRWTDQKLRTTANALVKKGWRRALTNAEREELRAVESELRRRGIVHWS